MTRRSFLHASQLAALALFLDRALPRVTRAQSTGVTATTQVTLRLRSAPTTDSATLALVGAGTTLNVLGRSAASNWVLVSYRNTPGWLAAWYCAISGDLSSRAGCGRADECRALSRRTAGGIGGAQRDSAQRAAAAQRARHRLRDADHRARRGCADGQRAQPRQRVAGRRVRRRARLGRRLAAGRQRRGGGAPGRHRRGQRGRRAAARAIAEHPGDVGAGPQPPIVPRAAWGARVVTTGYIPQTPQRITIHMDGEYFETADPIARMQTLQSWSMDTRGWVDIPYHYILDRAGAIYEGRPLTAQADTGTNYDPAGHIALTLMGDYNVQAPRPVQIDAMVALASWLAATYHISPDLIKGHRDYAYTDCPGQYLYFDYVANGKIGHAVMARLEGNAP